MEFLDIFTNYWVEWLFGIIAAGIGFGARHYIKIQRQVWENSFKEKAEAYRNEGIVKVEEELKEVKRESDDNDKEMKSELKTVNTKLKNLETGILSIQGKQFRETCRQLLNPDHKIDLEEYRLFEEDYTAYKNLGGNHTGDTFHERVVRKFDEQTAAKISQENKGQE